MAGRDFLVALHADLALYQMVVPAPETSQIMVLLDKAILGDCDLLDDRGEVIMPHWAERRGSARVPVHCPAFLFQGALQQNVVLRDISTKGLGLDEVRDVSTGDHVIVQAGQWLSVDGTIVWCRGTRAAIQLLQPIYSDDPRMTFCSALSGASVPA